MGAVPDLPVHPFDHIVGSDLRPVLRGKVAVGQGFPNSILNLLRCLRQLHGLQFGNHGGSLLPGRFLALLGVDCFEHELTRRGRKDGHGNVKWSCVKISRILRSATYMGYIGYDKSKVNNFLEKKRSKNLDESTFILRKGDFEPIVTEALLRQCEEIRKNRIRTLQMPSGEERRQGTKIIQHLWVRKLRCRCGAGYNRFKWRVLQDLSLIHI